MEKIKALNVYMDESLVGTLAEMKDGRIAFEYSKRWLENGFSISPFSLPLEPGVFVPKSYETFNGLHGVFAESLPAGFGKRVFEEYFSESGINPSEISVLNRLACTGKLSNGALSYRPVDASKKEFQTGLENIITTSYGKYLETEKTSEAASPDELESYCRAMREENEEKNAEKLFVYSGFCRGEKPKADYRMSDEDWIIKFPDVYDAFNMGEQEYAYNFCAAKCGIEIPSCRLIPSCTNLGYFAEKRFDRDGEKRLHVLSAEGLLETSCRNMSLDYDIILRLTIKLTQSFEEVEKMFRLMCFNVFSGNKDNGTDNISFIKTNDGWRLAPAYDLTYSAGKGGEYAISTAGNRKEPGSDELIKVAVMSGLNRKKAEKTAEEIKEKVRNDLAKYFVRR